MNTHNPARPSTHSVPQKAAIVSTVRESHCFYFARALAVAVALVALFSTTSYGTPNEADLIRVRDRGAQFPKLPNLEPVFLEGGGATTESLVRERNVFLAEARQNLVKTNDGNGDIAGYLVLTTTNTRNLKFVSSDLSTELKLQVLDRYGNEIKQYNEAANGGKLFANDINSLQLYRKVLEKIIRDLARDVPDITLMLGEQQGTPQQAEYIANLVVGNQINSQQIAEIARINKANLQAIQVAQQQAMLQTIASIAGAVQNVAGNIQQQQEYKKQQEQYRQQQAQYQQRQAQLRQTAQNTGPSAETLEWQRKDAEAHEDAAKANGSVAAKAFSASIGGGDAPTFGDLAVRNSDRQLARNRDQILADSMRRDTQRAQTAAAELAASTPPTPPPPPPSPAAIAPVPVIVNNAAPVVLQQAPQYTAPVAAADYKQQVSQTPAQQPASTAFSQQIEGGTAEADKLFRMGLNAATSADASKNFNPWDTSAELAREHYYRDANQADAKQQSQAFTFFTYAAKQGNRPAMYHLALMYKYGRGTPQNDAEAAKWLAAAAAASYEPAIELQNKTTAP